MEHLMVKQVMTEGVQSIRANEDLSLLYDLMGDYHCRHMPVVDSEGVVIGVISQRDLMSSVMGDMGGLPIGQLRDLLANTKVEEIMSTDVETVDPECDLEEAAEIMLENKIGCLPVVESNGRLVGILTESDFVRWVRDHNQSVPAGDGWVMVG